MAWLKRWLALSSHGLVLAGLVILNALVIWRFGVRSRLYAPPDAIAAQLAFWPSVFAGIVGQWGADRAHAFVRTLWQLDFVFPLLYASFLRGLYVWLGRTLGGGTRPPLEWAPWIAAALDWVENLLQIRLVGLALAGATGGSGFSAGVLLMSTCAALKIGLLLVSVLGTLAVLLRSQVGWALGTCRFAILSLLLGALPIASTSQGLDLLRVVADDAVPLFQSVVVYATLLLWATSVWYWSRVLLQIRWRAGEPGGAGEREDAGRRITTWLPRTLGSATLLLAAGAFAKASSGMPAELHGKLVLHAAGCLVLAGAFLYVVTERRRALGLGLEPQRFESWRELPRPTRGIGWTSLAVSGVFFLLFVLAPVGVGDWLGAPAIVFLAAANAVFFGSLSVLASRALRVPVVVFALVAAAVFSRFNDNHAVRLVDGVPPPRPQLLAAFEDWVRPRLAEWDAAQKPGPLPVFLVAAEGGGIRAAYWTAVVLGRLSDLHPGFARHVFGISGVSGGSLGAAVYVALLHDHVPEAVCRTYAEARGHGSAGVGPTELCAQEVLRQDFLAPVVGRLLAPDFLQWFLPVPVPVFDRSRALEASWSTAYERVTGQGTLDQPFLEVSRCRGSSCADEAALAYPALLLNGTHVHTGQRLLRAPVAWPNFLADDPGRDELPQVTDLTELLQGDVRLSSAAHDSARFAYVSPAGRLLSSQGRDFGHVVDGGYFENSGAATLSDVLHVLADSPLAGRVEFVLVYLCNNPGRCFGATVGSDPAEAQDRAPSLGEAFTPVRALLGAREARGGLAIAHLRQLIGRRFLEFGVCPVVDEPPVPLGWQLSEVMRMRLSVQARGAGAPGNRSSEGCVEQALRGELAGPACEPPFTPAEGCPPGLPPTVSALRATAESQP